ncbi:MAG TPA: hypothetical protein EYP90_03680, partial [Chromatiaceae bacterium]|nr:hypothetical protein [Chromatiaceae bacterium]
MVSIASLSTRQTPPLRVPMRFFLSVPLFMGLAGLMLLLSDSLALQGRWTPQVLALTHLWVLGMMLLAMLGASQQVVPVLLGVTIVHAEWVGFGSYLLLVPGILALAGGFLTGETELFLVAAPALGGGVLLVVLAVLEALTRSPSVHATAWGIRLALIALLVTVGLGSWLALGSGGIVVLRREWTDLHLGWGLLGWSVLLLSAVAWHVVPMFQVTPRYPSLLMR